MTTPMMKQHRSIKAQVPDAILFFRLGDFYEMFGEDAQTAAPILEIALTGRDAGEGKRIPMCGVPYHAAEGYLNKLVSAGHKVAICEQVEDPKATKGIVRREVIRIVSPGTITESLADRSNNFLASIFHDNDWGLAFLDVSTGEFTIFQTDSLDIILTELSRINPAELLLPNELVQSKHFYNYYKTPREKRTYLSSDLREDFPKQLDLFSDFPVATKAANALWQYFEETLPGIEPSHILEIKSYRSNQWMMLDSWTRRNLELTESLRGQNKKGTLLSVLDYTKTAFGGRLLRRWIEQPLIIKEEIEARFEHVEALVDNGFARDDLNNVLQNVFDLERLMGKVSYGTAHARDLLSLTRTISVLPAIRNILIENHSDVFIEYVSRLEGLDELTLILEQALNSEAPITLKEGNLIKVGYSEELDELRAISSGGKEWVAQLENSEKERTGIRSLKVGYNKVFGYYIEVTHANAHLVPEYFIRKQTLANAERYITPELKEYEQKILGAQEKIVDLEYQLFLELREKVRSFASKILQVANALAEIDVYLSLAEAAVSNHYIRPELTEDKLEIQEGRHPVVEKNLEIPFVPNDTVLTPERHLALITGPNMAGKSTYMRQVALVVLMAQIGSFVPAEKAKISIMDHIFTRVGASDDLASGQSTFMVEMREVGHILRNVTERSLIILDEVGRGTATYDGLSIAWSIAEYLVTQSIHPKILFATHYHELTELEERIPGIFNLHVGVKEHGDDIVFLHKIIPGRADRSYGIQVAKLAGLPNLVLRRARAILKELETSSDTDRVHLLSENNIFDVNNMIAKEDSVVPFDVPKVHSLLQEVEGLSIDDLTPREALDYLYDLRARIKNVNA